MRNNLILCNSKEGLNEKPADTEDIVRNFMMEKLDLARDVVNPLQALAQIWL